MPQDFEYNLSRVLAHTIVYESKLDCPFDFRCEDPAPPSAGESGRKLLRGLNVTIPAVNTLTNQQVLPAEQTLLSAAQATSPQYAKMQQDIFANAMKQLAATQADLAKGAGKDQALSLDALARQIDPELYAARSATGGVIGNTANAINQMISQPISESELSAIERGLNRLNNAKGLTDVPSNTSTISNAMTYGSAGRDRLTQALQLATGFVPAATSFIPAAKSYDKSSTGDVASAAAFAGGARSIPTLGAQAQNLTGSLLGESGQTQRLAQQLNADRMLAGEKAYSILSDMGIVKGAGGAIGGLY